MLILTCWHLHSSKSYIFNSTVVEAFVAWEVVEFSRDLELQHVIVEGDALEIVQDLLKEWRCWSRYGQLIDDAKIAVKSARTILWLAMISKFTFQPDTFLLKSSLFLKEKCYTYFQVLYFFFLFWCDSKNHHKFTWVYMHMIYQWWFLLCT
jgi:hypothetical protein